MNLSNPALLGASATEHPTTLEGYGVVELHYPLLTAVADTDDTDYHKLILTLTLIHARLYRSFNLHSLLSLTAIVSGRIGPRRLRRIHHLDKVLDVA